MSSFDDLDLNGSSRYPILPPRRSLPIGPIVSVVILCVALAAFWWYRSTRSSTSTPAAIGPSATGPARSVPSPSAPASTTLPPLDALDPVVRARVGELTQMSAATAWLGTDHLAEQFTAIVQGVAEGQAPSRLLARFRPATPFAVTQHGTQTVIDPASFSRYDGIADTVASLDPEASVRVYRTFAPRLTEAYDQLGISNSTLDSALEAAIIRLVKTPVPAGDIAVVPRGGAYAFADPALESLSPAQKLLLRTGPANARRIQARLREIGLALGIPAARL